MAAQEKTERYVVSNVGYGYAVHDTQGRVHDGDGPPRSRNRLNAPILEVCSTREMAVTLAAVWNARASSN